MALQARPPVIFEGAFYQVFMFAKEEHAEIFRAQFGGERMHPSEKAKARSGRSGRKEGLLSKGLKDSLLDLQRFVPRAVANKEFAIALSAAHASSITARYVASICEENAGCAPAYSART